MAVIEIETSEKISETLLQVFDSLGCWYKYIELFDEFDRVRDKAANLFSYIIDLVVHARIYYQQRRRSELALLGHEKTYNTNEFSKSDFSNPLSVTIRKSLMR